MSFVLIGLNKFHNTGAGIFDSIIHVIKITLKYHFGVKKSIVYNHLQNVIMDLCNVTIPVNH